MIRNSFSHSFSSLFLYCADFCSVFARADLLTVTVIVQPLPCSSSNRVAIIRGGVEDTRLEAKDSLSEDRHSRGQGQECSRPRTSKCVLEAKDVLEDSTSGNYNEYRCLWKLWLCVIYVKFSQLLNYPPKSNFRVSFA